MEHPTPSSGFSLLAGQSSASKGMGRQKTLQCGSQRGRVRVDAPSFLPGTGIVALLVGTFCAPAPCERGLFTQTGLPSARAAFGQAVPPEGADLVCFCSILPFSAWQSSVTFDGGGAGGSGLPSCLLAQFLNVCPRSFGEISCYPPSQGGTDLPHLLLPPVWGWRAPEE